MQSSIPAAQILPDGRFVSFAQNGEDAVLLRVFRDQPEGFWIDIGANHPVRDSVTKNFSTLGWSGINVEPVASLHEELVRDRPTDINILAGVSDHSGSMVFHRNDSNLDLSTFRDELADHYRGLGHDIVDIDVPVLTLREICDEHAAGRTIDFLKIDAEGHELAVLEGHDFDRYPPRVVLVEFGIHEAPIEDFLLGVGMRTVLFDGVNQWFVRDGEDDDFVRQLSRPPVAVLDGYHPHIYLVLLAQKEDWIQAQHGRIAELEEECARLRSGATVDGTTRRRLSPSWLPWRR